jgi:hypothetical protein
MERKRSRFTLELVLAIAFLALFLFMLWSNIAFFRFIHWYCLIAFFAPVAIFAGMYFIRRKHSPGRKAWVVAGIACGIFLAFFESANYFLMSLDDDLSPVQDVHSYANELQLNGYPDNESLAHFPAKIPDGAQNVRFYDNPAFGPGPFAFLLRYDTDAAGIDALYERFTPVANRFFTMRSVTDEAVLEQIDSLSFFANDIGYARLPDDFDIILLGGESTEANWSDGYAWGLAVSRQRNEVILFSIGW